MAGRTLDFSKPRERALDLGTDAPAKVRLKLTQSRSYVAFGERAVVTAEATLDGAPVKLEMKSANLQKLVGTPGVMPPTVASVHIRDDGRAPDERAGDGKLSGGVPFTSPDLEGFQGEVALGVHAVAAGEEGYIGYRFAFGGTAPARFTGRVWESVENGSIVLRLELDVLEAGEYRFLGRLYDSERRPVALMSDSPRLEPGKHQVRLVGFGALLRERGSRAPFELRDVEGSLVQAGGSPDRRAIEPWLGPHRTRKYAADAFSTAPYELDGSR